MEVNELIKNIRLGKYKYIKITCSESVTIRRLSKVSDGKIYSILDGTEVVVMRPLPKYYKMIENGYSEIINLGKFGKRRVIVEFLSTINTFNKSKFKNLKK